MPLYEYHCNQCHIDFEVRRSFSDTGTPECPVCHENTHVTRKFSAPAIVFKGSGFYVNDSRGKNAAGAPARSNGNGKSTVSESAPAAKSETKSETKAKVKSD
jgi:putative FmdB family regulatory protein